MNRSCDLSNSCLNSQPVATSSGKRKQAGICLFRTPTFCKAGPQMLEISSGKAPFGPSKTCFFSDFAAVPKSGAKRPPVSRPVPLPGPAGAERASPRHLPERRSSPDRGHPTAVRPVSSLYARAGPKTGEKKKKHAERPNGGRCRRAAPDAGGAGAAPAAARGDPPTPGEHPASFWEALSAGNPRGRTPPLPLPGPEGAAPRRGSHPPCPRWRCCRAPTA